MVWFFFHWKCFDHFSQLTKRGQISLWWTFITRKLSFQFHVRICCTAIGEVEGKTAQLVLVAQEGSTKLSQVAQASKPYEDPRLLWRVLLKSRGFVSWLYLVINSFSHCRIFRSCRSFQRRLHRLLIKLIQLRGRVFYLISFLIAYWRKKYISQYLITDLSITGRRQILKAVYSEVPSSMHNFRGR